MSQMLHNPERILKFKLRLEGQGMHLQDKDALATGAGVTRREASVALGCECQESMNIHVSL